MPIGGFGGPSGRRVRSVERALTASALLPTVAFAALGSLTVLLVVQMGISPLGAAGGPSARDGGHDVTMPRMSISIGPQRLQYSARSQDRETTTADDPTTLDLVRPVEHTIPIAATRARETTTADAQTGSTHPFRLTTLIFTRPVAHTIRPAHDRATTTPHVEPAAMTAAFTDVAVTNATVFGRAVTDVAVTDVAVTDPTIIDRAVTFWEVTNAAVEPQVQAGTYATDAPEVTYALLARAATAPALEPDDRKPQTPQNEDASVTSVKTPQNTDETQASEQAKAAKSGP